MLDLSAFEGAVRAGIEARSRGDLAEAIGFFEQACALHPHSAGALQELGFTCLRANYASRAMDIYQEACLLGPQQRGAWIGLGQACRALNRPADAAFCLQRALVLDPPIAPLLRDLAASLGEAGCAVSLPDCLTNLPDETQAWVRLGLLARAIANHARAATCFRHALDRQPHHRGIAHELAFSHRAAGNQDGARQLYESLLADDSHDAAALTGLAAFERQAGAHDRAAALLERAAAVAPDHPGVLGELAYSFLSLNRPDKAEPIYQRMLDNGLEIATAHRGLAEIARRHRRYEAALAAARQAAEAAPENPAHATLVCALLRESGDLQAAREEARRLIAEAPAHAGAWHEAGLVARDLLTHADGLAAFQRATALGHPSAWREEAAMYLALGQPAQARAIYEQRLEAEPSDLASLLGLARLHLLAEAPGLAAGLAEAAAEAHPASLEAYRVWCDARLALGDRAGALAIAEAASRRAPDASDAACLHLRLLCQIGARKAAESALSSPPFSPPESFQVWLAAMQARLALFQVPVARALLGNPPAASRQERATIAAEEGRLASLEWQLEAATEAFLRAVSLCAGHAESHRQLARLFVLQADPQAAALHLRRALALERGALMLRGRRLNSSQSLTGQLINEMRLTPALTQALAAAKTTDCLQALALENSQATLPALMLLARKAQAGKLTPSQRSQTEIPAIILQCWDERSPSGTPAEPGWAETHPDFAYHSFGSAEAAAYLAANADETILRAFLKALTPSQAADIFRLAWLLRHGGFYVSPCVTPAGILETGCTDWLAILEPHGNLGTQFLAAAPAHPVIAHALAQAVKAVLRGDTDNVWLATGPGLLTRAYAQCEVGQATARILQSGEAQQIAVF